MMSKIFKRWGSKTPKTLSNHDNIKQSLEKLLLESTIETNSLWNYELSFKIQLPGSKGYLKFCYNAIRKKFYGSMLFFSKDCTLIFDYYSFSVLSGEAEKYADILNLVINKLPEVNNKAVIFQKEHGQKEKNKRNQVQSSIDNLLN